MTDKPNAFTIYLDDTTTKDDAALLVNAIRRLPGVRDIQHYQEQAPLLQNIIASVHKQGGFSVIDSAGDYHWIVVGEAL